MSSVPDANISGAITVTSKVKIRAFVLRRMCRGRRVANRLWSGLPAIADTHAASNA
ncbi:MAG TPA: hypothetical protein VN989_07915 [Casimicrobiaceae bacterium]|nr:hypothetical protein [Casimicrobiaceae bacterium]